MIAKKRHSTGPAHRKAFRRPAVSVLAVLLLASVGVQLAFPAPAEASVKPVDVWLERDVSIAEGNSGTTVATFWVSARYNGIVFPWYDDYVTVDFDTSDGTAVAGSDYAYTHESLTLHVTGLDVSDSQPVSVLIGPDTTHERDEYFNADLSNSNSRICDGKTCANQLNPIFDGHAVGNILDDPDPVPSVSVNSVSVNEGNSGVANANFTVSLSPASEVTATVGFATANGTAVAGSDYAAAAGTVTFSPGETRKTVGVAVAGDATFEPNETFSLGLSS